MALIAEQIVEEWLTRQGYFTIRGLKVGNDELDLLAVKIGDHAILEFIHIEVQVSIRPVSYITPLSKIRQIQFNINGTRNAKTRSMDQLEIAVDDWVNKKFFSDKKNKLRYNLSKSDQWRFLFVYGNVKEMNEVLFINKKGIEIQHIGAILVDLNTNNFEYTTSSGTDVLELISFLKP